MTARSKDQNCICGMFGTLGRHGDDCPAKSTAQTSNRRSLPEDWDYATRVIRLLCEYDPPWKFFDIDRARRSLRALIPWVQENFAGLSDETPALHRSGSEPLSRLAGDLDYCLSQMTPGHVVYKRLQGVKDQLRAASLTMETSDVFVWREVCRSCGVRKVAGATHWSQCELAPGVSAVGTNGDQS